MADATLQILLKAIDQSTAVLKSVEGQLLGLEGSQQRASQAGAGLTATAVAAGVALEQLGQKTLAVVEDVAKMTVEWESATVALQNQADLTDAAMGTVSHAILTMAENSHFSATEIAEALARVAGRFETATGAALDGAKSTILFGTSADLAAAAGTGLNEAMTALVDVMLAYKVPLSELPRLSDQLFNTSRMTGTAIGELATAADRLKDKLGNAAPDIGQMGALLAELTAQGLSGQRGLLAVSGGLATLTSNSDAVNTVLRNLGAGVYNAQGNFIGMRAVIAELVPIFATLTQQQQTEAAQTLFGAGAAGVLLNVIKDGVGAYDQFTARVNESGEAAEAATRTEATLAEQMAVLRNHVDALARGFGGDLAPWLGKIVGLFNPLLNAIENNSQAATALGIVLGSVVVAGVIAVTVALGAMAVAAWTAYVGISAALLGIPILIGLVIAAVYLLANNWDAVWGAMKAAPGFLRDHVKEIIQGIVLLFVAGPIGLIVRYWGDIFEHMPEPVQNAMNFVAGIVEWIVKHLLGLFATVIDKIADLLSAIGDAADALSNMPGFGAVFGGASDVIDGVTSKLYGLADAARETAAALNLTMGAATASLNFAQAGFEAIRSKFAVSLNFAQPGWEQVLARGGTEPARPVVPPPPPGTGGGTAAPAGPSQAELDLLALAVAFDAFHVATQGTLEDFLVLLTVASDRIDLNKRLAQAQIALRTAEIEAADGAYQLKEMFVALAEDAVRSGRTMKEELADLWTQLLSKWESQFNELINKPTREGSELQLRVDQLKLQRDLLARGGGDTKALDAQITALEQEQRIRQDQLAILKDQNQLMLAANFTDRDLVNQLALTVLAEHVAMTKVEEFGTAAYNEVAHIKSLGEAADFAADQLRVIGYLTAPPPAPVASYAVGITYVPRDMLALVHRGERITPAEENLALTSGRSGGSASPSVQYQIQIENHITADGDINDAQIRKLARIIRQEQESALGWARSGGSQPPGGAFG